MSRAVFTTHRKFACNLFYRRHRDLLEVGYRATIRVPCRFASSKCRLDLRVLISGLAFPLVAYLSTMPYKKNISPGSGPDAIRQTAASVGCELQCDARLPSRLYFLC